MRTGGPDCLPDKGLGRPVMLIDKAVDCRPQIADRAEDAVLQPPTRQDGEEALGGVEPRTRRRREVQGQSADGRPMPQGDERFGDGRDSAFRNAPCRSFARSWQDDGDIRRSRGWRALRYAASPPSDPRPGAGPERRMSPMRTGHGSVDGERQTRGGGARKPGSIQSSLRLVGPAVLDRLGRRR